MWNKYFSKPERQRKQTETLACTDFARNNAAEAKLNYKHKKGQLSRTSFDWADGNGYTNPDTDNFDLSDRALAKWSDTSKTGNVQSKVNRTAEEMGSVPEKIWPFKEEMTWDEYYKEIPEFIEELGQDWKIYFDENHQWVRKNDFNKRIKQDPIIGFVFAWKEDNGVYYRPDNVKYSNHAIVVQGPSQKKNGHKVWPIRDTYPPFDKLVYDSNLNPGGYAVDVIDKYNLDIMEFLKKNDQKLVRNKKTGAYGAIYHNMLYVITEERAGLFMVDREARNIIGKYPVVPASDKVWRSLPQKEF